MFSNIFAASEPAFDGTCAEGTQLVNVVRPECLKVRRRGGSPALALPPLHMPGKQPASLPGRSASTRPPALL